MVKESGFQPLGDRLGLHFTYFGLRYRVVVELRSFPGTQTSQQDEFKRYFGRVNELKSIINRNRTNKSSDRHYKRVVLISQSNQLNEGVRFLSIRKREIGESFVNTPEQTFSEFVTIRNPLKVMSLSVTNHCFCLRGTTHRP